MRMGDHSISSWFGKELFEGEICFGGRGGMKGEGKRIKVTMMPLRLSIDKKDAEVDCIRLGGANN